MLELVIKQTCILQHLYDLFYILPGTLRIYVIPGSDSADQFVFCLVGHKFSDDKVCSLIAADHSVKNLARFTGSDCDILVFSKSVIMPSLSFILSPSVSFVSYVFMFFDDLIIYSMDRLF